MPTYIYRCNSCHATFERVETLAEQGVVKSQCPTCGRHDVVSAPAPFTAITGKKS